MKKMIFMAALASLALTANAQSKEELKAIKAATKEAEKVVKKAQSEYDSGIANPQMGRKEANWEKLTEAKTLITQALSNQYTSNSADTYKTAANIAAQFYNKYDGQIKAGDESAKPQLLEISKEIITYTIKWDELENANPNKKAQEYTKDHTYYQNLATNPAIQCLQAAQSYSNSDNQEELKQGSELASVFVDAMTKSHLFSDFTNDNKDEWISYAKVFKAQSLVGVEGANASDIESAYMDLVGTKYESVCYSALANYFREKDPAKYVDYLKLGMEKGDAENAPNFAFMLMQHQFNSSQFDDCLKTIQLIKEKYPDNENTLNAYLMEGQIYFQDKKYAEAEKLFADAVAKYPNDDRAITMPAKSAWMKAQSSGDKKDLNHAIELFKKLEANYPSQPDFWGEPLYILYNNVGNNAARDKYKKYYNVK